MPPLADAVDEGVFEVFVAKSLASEAHPPGIARGSEQTPQFLDQRVVHRPEKNGRLPVYRNPGLVDCLVDL